MYGLVFPAVLFFCFLLSLIAFLFGFRKLGAAVLLISIVIDVYAECIPLRLFRKNAKPTAESISLLCFNIHSPSESFSYDVQNIADLIIEQDADFALVTEYYLSDCSDTLNDRLLRAGYNCLMRRLETGNALYYKDSRKDIAASYTSMYTGNISLINASSSEKDFSIYFCHLSSNNYDSSRQNYSTPDDIKDIDGLKFYLNRIEGASELRCQEVDSLLKSTRTGAAPTIVLGDMNDVSGSPAMNVLRKAGFQDAWWKGGFGYGATIHDPLPFRIDHVLYNDGLRLKAIKKICSNGWSDHDALYAVFEVR